MAEHIELVMTALGGVLFITIGLVGYISKRQINRIDGIENGNKEIKFNYISRFELNHQAVAGIKDDIHKFQLLVIQRMDKQDLDTSIVRQELKFNSEKLEELLAEHKIITKSKLRCEGTD